MRITLDYKIDIDVREGDKSKEKLSVFLREPTHDEKREQKGVEKKFLGIWKRGQKIGFKQDSFAKKAELYERSGEYAKALEAIERKDALDADLEALEAELEELGGGDKEAFAEESAKKRFDALVGGKDKEKLETYAEIKGYVNIMRSLDIAKAELEKKQSGE